MYKRIFILITLLAAMVIQTHAAVTFGNEELSYRVTYKWGIIRKTAGSARINLNKHNDCYSAVLTARTQPWADRIFMVRDTLSGRMRLSDMSPLLYDKSTHEENVYRHDVIRYSYNGDRITARCNNFRENKEHVITRRDTTLYAKMPGCDMLSVYYLVRRLPFETMKPGTVFRANIFSGKKLEYLAIIYDGDETIKLNGHKHDCYRIHFTFSSERLKESSAPMKAWLRKDRTRVPVKLVGSLPIGQIQVLLNE